MNRGHYRNSEINVAPLVSNSESTVLRHTALGDVELRHHLDTGDQRLMISEVDRINLGVKGTIDPILNLHLCVARFYVNIRCPRFHRVVNDSVDEFDNRRHLRICGQPIEVEHLLAMLSFSYQRNSKS